MYDLSNKRTQEGDKMNSKRDRIIKIVDTVFLRKSEGIVDEGEIVTWATDEIMLELRKAQQEAYSNGYQKGKKSQEVEDGKANL
jgi:hypothetical protein